MNPNNFVIQMRKTVIADALVMYRDKIFNPTESELKTATDPYWIRVFSLYAKLNKDDKEVFFEVIRQIMVDTISDVFGILDGVSFLEDQGEDEFHLFIGNSKEPLNGDLQDLFLELEEEERGDEGR